MITVLTYEEPKAQRKYVPKITYLKSNISFPFSAPDPLEFIYKSTYLDAVHLGCQPVFHLILLLILP